ncbi:tRNA (adenosine(37)-N6)-dimethylallyltransferase MiaA [Pontivivens insulae]|uniref:tRNA dimethylallyltransferase n=1 Tax=Pontivivens insulae TaxID=1639689 RepID=A0A2R8AB57_9RHOB|nr:tRNA (adenosine(37)-N6)-dimethylallyltransferase MiaA [Pontivivens insulae]RED13198.1 tRNA dimethylallyltransferase [Pontivivens insulae]SPF29290.1 tRNA dimethylallyltransferase [Pontivivens insulae]
MRALPPTSLVPSDPILIAGPTASGKSALALALAQRDNGIIINADALQVYSGWRVLTARPSPADEVTAPHALYGHVANHESYSTGHWLRDLRAQLRRARHAGHRPIIIGGTGLNFAAATDGLADIPPTPPSVRTAADALGAEGMRADLLREDSATLARIDTANPMRIQRAWEVLRTTGRPLADWQDETPAPDLPLERTVPILLRPDVNWLNDRIARRFDLMLAEGALEEAAANRTGSTPGRPSSRALGAPELIAYLKGEMTLETAAERTITATRQYAKRQRTWFRSRMSAWTALDPAEPVEALCAQVPR